MANQQQVLHHHTLIIPAQSWRRKESRSARQASTLSMTLLRARRRRRRNRRQKQPDYTLSRTRAPYPRPSRAKWHPRKECIHSRAGTLVLALLDPVAVEGPTPLMTKMTATMSRTAQRYSLTMMTWVLSSRKMHLVQRDRITSAMLVKIGSIRRA